MKRYIKEYIKQLETSIQEQKEFSKEEREEIKCKILFFQHERFIHLVVTIAFSFAMFLFLVLGMLSYIFLIPFFILVVFLLFYIIHYFFLENEVQYLYRLYDKVLEYSKH